MGLGSVFKGIKKVVKPIAKFAAPALAFTGLGLPASLALGAGLGALSGNGIKGILGGALSAGAGGLGTALTGSGLGGALGGLSGLSGNAIANVGSGLAGAAGGALGGGGLKGALLSGGLAGLGQAYGNGSLGSSFDSIKSGLGLQGSGVGSLGTGTNTASAGVAGGGNSSYSSVIKDPSAGFGFTSPTGGISTSASVPSVTGGITANPAASNPSWFSKVLDKGNIVSPLVSAGLSTYSNAASADALQEQQQKNLAAIQPYLNDKFNPGDLENDPGYQFQLEQGTKAIDRAAASRGNYFSGQALTDAAKYGTGLADSTYNEAYQRWLSNRNANLGAVLGANGYNENIGNINANQITNTSNGLAGAGAALLGQQGIGNNGQTLGGNGNIQSLLAGLSPEQIQALRAQLG